METNKHSLLNQLVKQPPTLPDDAYFSSLHETLLQQATPIETVTIRKPNSAFIFATGIAASFVLWVGLTIESETKSVDFTSLEKHEIIHYLKNDVMDLDEELISPHVSDQVVAKMEYTQSKSIQSEGHNELTQATVDFSIEEIDDATLLDYLDDESDLIEEL